MKIFILITLAALTAGAAVQPGYKYSGPARQQQVQAQQLSQPIRPSIPIRAQSNAASSSASSQSQSGIYSAVQSLPLAQFNVQPERQQNFVPQSSGPVIGLQAPLHQQQPIQQHHQHQQPIQQHHQQQHNSVPQQQPLVLAPQPVQHHVPQAQPHDVYLPPQQQQPQHQHQQQQQQQHQQQPIAAIPSIPQGHQQQVVQQQLGGFQQQQQQQFGQQQLGGFQQPLHQQSLQSVSRPQTAIITKDIYIHSAPDDHDDGSNNLPLDNGPIRKNYRIVFIKAPSQNLGAAAAALKRAQSANEEKTVIYVLSKKPDLSEVHQQLQQAQSEQKTNKPEVYFIKYKTQEEAQRAQQQIQAQYDALGGSTHISDEGVAPLTTVSGSANLSGPIFPTGSGSSSSSGQHVPSQHYGVYKK